MFSSDFAPSDFLSGSSTFTDTLVSSQRKSTQNQNNIKQNSIDSFEPSILHSKLETNQPQTKPTQLYIIIHQLMKIRFPKKKTSDFFNQAFIKMRIHPDLPIIQTETVASLNSDPVLSCGYKVDYTKILPEEMSKYAITFELYCITSSGEKLLGFAILPLTLLERKNIQGKEVQFFYKNEQIYFENEYKRNVGTVQITIALGFDEHHEFFDELQKQGPHFLEITEEVKLHPEVEKPKIPNPFAFDQKEEKEEDIMKNTEKKKKKVEKKPKKQQRRHHKRKSSNWMEKARLHGWLPPGSLKDDWKEKAKENGWIQVKSIILSEYGIQCNQFDVTDTQVAEIQTERDTEKSEIDYSSKSPVDDLAEILQALNPDICDNNDNIISNVSDIIIPKRVHKFVNTGNIVIADFEDRPAKRGISILGLSDEDLECNSIVDKIEEEGSVSETVSNMINIYGSSSDEHDDNMLGTDEFLAQYVHKSIIKDVQNDEKPELSKSVITDSEDSEESFLIEYLKKKVNSY